MQAAVRAKLKIVQISRIELRDRSAPLAAPQIYRLTPIQTRACGFSIPITREDQVGTSSAAPVFRRQPLPASSMPLASFDAPAQRKTERCMNTFVTRVPCATLSTAIVA